MEKKRVGGWANCAKPNDFVVLPSDYEKCDP
jgi:hypothetical protein